MTRHISYQITVAHQTLDMGKKNGRSTFLLSARLIADYSNHHRESDSPYSPNHPLDVAS